jgi:hypothetical protein
MSTVLVPNQINSFLTKKIGNSGTKIRRWKKRGIKTQQRSVAFPETAPVSR